MSELAPENNGAELENGSQGQEAQAANTGSETPADFLSMLSDDNKVIAESKGWPDANEMIKSYTNLEKMVGGRVKIPEEGDTDAWNDLYNRLGRPEDASHYDFSNVETINDEAKDWFGKAAHEVGLNANQAGKLFKDFSEFSAAQDEADAVAAQAEREVEMTQLRKEWGGAYDDKVSLAKAAVGQFGVSPEVLESMEKAMGDAGLIRHFAAIGERLGEHNFVDNGDNKGVANGMSLSPAQAKNQVNELLGDPSFKARYQRGDEDAVKRISDLMAASVG